MVNRREFLGALGIPAAAVAVGGGFSLVSSRAARAGDRLRELAKHKGAPNDIATDEDFWFEVSQAFTVDRSLVNLNNGGVAPAPRSVLDAMHGHVMRTNHAPSRYLWRLFDPQVETVRQRIAHHFGCDAEEIAITRNASESLEIALYGIDLKAGDEVLTTSHDYPRMLNTLKQREERDKRINQRVRLKQFLVLSHVLSRDYYALLRRLLIFLEQTKSEGHTRVNGLGKKLGVSLM